jgi:hypothetical protein
MRVLFERRCSLIEPAKYEYGNDWADSPAEVNTVCNSLSETYKDCELKVVGIVPQGPRFLIFWSRVSSDWLEYKHEYERQYIERYFKDADYRPHFIV